MKTSLKKLVASASIVALVAMNGVYAMSLTGSTTSLSLTWQTVWQSYSWTTVAWALNLDVSAQVLPTLSFSIGTWVIDLGVLESSKVSTWAMNITLSTNATNWAMVSVSSVNSWLTSSQWDVIAYSGVVSKWVESYNLTVADATTTLWDMPTIDNATVSSASSTTIMSVDNPTDTAKVNVQSNASISSITPAWNYTIQHVFTVTWSF